MIAIWSSIMTLITVAIGSLTDALGIRRTFLIGFWICLISRIVMALTVERWIVLPAGLYMQAIGLALMVPVMIAGVKKYTNAAQRSVAFSLYYALMNLGFAAGDWLFDRLRNAEHGLGEYGSWVVPGLGMELRTYRVLILIGAVFTVPGLIVIQLFLREGVEMTERGVVIAAAKTRAAGDHWIRTALASCRETARKTLDNFVSLWGQGSFYRFMIFMTLVVGVRMIFFHLAYTFPKFGIRELGEGAPIAQISGMLNSILIVVLVPLVGVLTAKISAYRMVAVGSLISSLSVFFLVVPQHWFQPLAEGWLGHLVAHTWLGVEGAVNPLYVSSFLFIVFLSIGEAVWSPRLYEYAAAIAPRGQEATYMGLSLFPYFCAKLIGGGSSGWLLATFCPAEGPRHSSVLWLIVGGTALITPLGAFFFRRFIQVQEAGRESEVSRAEAAAEEEDAVQG